MSGAPTTLQAIRADLLTAIEADLARSQAPAQLRTRVLWRRRVVATTALIAGLSAAGVAAAYGPWEDGPAAPPAVQEQLERLGEKVIGEALPPNEGIEVARSGQHVLYASPTDAGGFCITVEGGGAIGGCTPFATREPLHYVAATGGVPVSGSVLGRVADATAVRVEITLAGYPPMMLTVGRNGFFIGDLPEEMARSLNAGPGPTRPIGPAKAFDAAGRVVATSP